MFHVGEEVIGGASAGVIGTLLGFPLDLVRVPISTSNIGSQTSDYLTTR